MKTVVRRFASIAPFLLFFPVLHAAQDRIATQIDKRQSVILRGHVNRNARPENDRGQVDPAFSLAAVTIHLKPSSSQQGALAQLLSGQQDPASPNYHKWLTPDQYADQFGVSQTDIDKITAWLESQGLTVTAVAPGRNRITLKGTAAQVQAAFGTQIHTYSVNGATHYANANDPAIPAALADMVTGITGLSNFHLQPRLVKSHESPLATQAGGTHHVVPDDLATIYDIAPLYTAGVDGTGQKIAVVGQTDIKLSDITAFRTRFNLPTANIQQVAVPNHPDPGVSAGDLGEADLDIEWAGAVARNATIVYVYSDDVMASLTHAVDQNLAPVITMSYGFCEAGSLGLLPLTQQIAQQANAQGQTWLAAAGDSGAADCDDPNAASAQNGLNIDSPGSTPEVTSVGGTEFVDGGGSYWSSTNSANGASALSYIPERVWNDALADQGLWAGGGGPSGFFAQPVWQNGPGVPNDGFRQVPDVSLSASADHDGYYVYSGGSGSYYGGTSVAAPSMAGIVALLNQYLVSTGAQSQPGVGNINPALYRLAKNVPGAFHQVIQGDNIVPCASSSPGCSTGSYGFKAAAGFNQATGLGSPDAYNLIHAWTGQAPKNSAVVPALDQNPVFQGQPDANGNAWTFKVTLNEEAGVATMLTGFTIDGKAYDINATFGSANIPARGSISSKNLGLANVAVPKTVTFGFTGVDASGYQWSEQYSVPFSGKQTALSVAGVANAASGQQAYAPGSIVSVYGLALGNFAQGAATIPLPTFLSGFAATVNGVLAPIYYVSPNQVNIQIPYETQPGSADLNVGNPYANVDYTIQVTAAAPGVFASNGMVSAPFSSAKRGQTSTLFITGEGQVRPSLATGDSPAAGTSTLRLPKPILPVSMTIGGVPATVVFAGIPSGLVGVTQVNFTVPANAPLGNQPVVVTVGTAQSMPVNLNVTQ